MGGCFCISSTAVELLIQDKPRYFSSLFAASRLFPNHIGMASGASMALFGLSPLFLSVIASTWFTDHATETLDVTKFTSFLAVFCCFVYLLGALSLRIDPTSDLEPSVVEGTVSDIDETTSLLSNQPKPPPAASEESLLHLLKQSDFWLLVVFCTFTLGAVRPSHPSLHVSV